MPLSIDDFEAGDLPEGPSVPEQVITHLYTHRDQAFTRSEITSAIGEDSNTVGTALSRLKSRDLIRHKGEYWAITEDLDRVSAAYEPHQTLERLDEKDKDIDVDAWEKAAPDSPHPSERDDDS
ncbi:hypothetical protein ACFR9U_14250 [Halorientalis brevis]|uniref:MarR family transcriptional regulator n=1 Tax=Halorientalis brevis TaxID=1126241 RepID=A0ABD6CDZ2_9EURY|nr:hypothetical protein [Halorientalis brevis]